MSATSIRAELAKAIRRTNARYRWAGQPEMLMSGESWSVLEDEVNEAIAAGDRDRALEAIRRWENHAKFEIVRAS